MGCRSYQSSGLEARPPELTYPVVIIAHVLRVIVGDPLRRMRLESSVSNPVTTTVLGSQLKNHLHNPIFLLWNPDTSPVIEEGRVGESRIVMDDSHYPRAISYLGDASGCIVVLKEKQEQQDMN